MLLMKDIIDDSNELIRTVSKEVELPLSKENHDLLMKMHEFLVASQDEEKQIDKEFQDVSGYSIYKVFKASQENDWIKL